MKKTSILLLSAMAVALTACVLMADDDDDEYHEDHEREEYEESHEGDERERGRATGYLTDPEYQLYMTECGDCHMAYPPTMLPVASWRTMMRDLADHFGDNAELDTATANEITAYLERHAAEKGRGEYGERAWRATRGRTPPLRISETDYFRGQHHEIPKRLVTGNPEVGSWSRCETCHRGADKGDFDEDGVLIPGHGRWDD